MITAYRAPPSTLHALVRSSAEARPDAPAVGHGAQRVSYAELDAMASRIAGRLRAAGVRPGDRVGLYQPKSIRGVAELLAISKCGAAYVPVDPSAPAERARWVFAHAGVEVVFAAGRPLAALSRERPDEDVRAGEAKAPAVARTLIVTEGPPSATAPAIQAGVAARVEHLDDALAADPIGELPNVPDTSLAYVLYTSGSTGTPKGVAITHAQSLTFVRTAAEAFELVPEDVVASHAPFNFDLSIIDLFCTFAAGARMEIIPETWLAFPARVAKLIEEAGISVWNSVPSALIQLATHGALETRDLSRLRLVMFAGEPFPIRHLRRLAEHLPKARLLNVYGQTEANSSTAYWIDALPESDDAPLPVGRALPNYGVLLLGPDGREIVEPGVEGELYVVGGAVASGYFGDPERTAAAFVQHPLRPGAREIVYKTGDRFARDARGDLIFRGRMDTAVKVRGFRVELAEVEGALLGHPRIHEAAVLALPSEALGHALVGFFAPAPDSGEAPITEAELLEHAAKRLPAYMLPVRLMALRALPRSPNGKIERRELEAAARLLITEP